MKLKKTYVIFSVSLAVASLLFFLSFTQFNVSLRTQEIVDGKQVFVSSDETAVDEFLDILEEERNKINADNKENITQGFGLGIFVDFRDSNGIVIPQEGNFLKVPFSDTFLKLDPTTASLVGTDGRLLDFAKIQFDVLAITLIDAKVQVTAKYQVLSNENVIFSGTVFGIGNTVNKQLNLKFEQGSKIGEAIELNFENGEIPMMIGHDIPITNTLEFRIVEIEGVIGEGFDTDRYYWKGDFPVYTLKYDADDKTRTIRDYRGIAIQTLPNDIGIQVCGYDSGRLSPGNDFSAFAPSITVKSVTGSVIMQSSSPPWGINDASFNSHKCGNIISGLERNTNYKFIMHDGSSFDIKTPNTPILYSASCVAKSSNSFPCISNFGWSR